MNSNDFIKAVKKYVAESTSSGLIDFYKKPGGRSPDKISVELSDFYNGLNSNEKIKINNIIKISVDAAIFNFLCVFDGVIKIIDEYNVNIVLENEEHQIKLNDNEEMLHDIYNSIVDN